MKKLSYSPAATPRSIPEPGLPGGPCAEACNHPACQQMRLWAEQVYCQECRELIGYDTRYFEIPYFPWEPHAIHGACLDRLVEQLR